MTNTNFDSTRHKFQETVEGIIGCPDPIVLKDYKGALEALCVDARIEAILASALRDDIANTYFKALLSIAEAINSINRGFHSWPVVKLYYSVFYLVRVTFAVRSIGVVRCDRSVYTLAAKAGAKPVKRNGKGDHKILIGSFVNEYAESEALLSNKIQDKNVFDWLMGRREAVNYRDATFYEPELKHFDPTLTRGSLSNWVKIYLNDDTLSYTFLDDHACLAAPLKLAQQVVKEIRLKNLDLVPLSTNQRKSIASLLAHTGVLDLREFQELVNADS